MTEAADRAHGPNAPDFFRLLAENISDDAIFVIDGERRVQTWSPASERLFGYTEAEIVGQSADVFFTAEDRQTGRPDQEVRQALGDGQAIVHRWQVRKDGTRFWSAGVLTPLRDRSGRLHGFCKVLRDETPRHEAATDRLNAEKQSTALWPRDVTDRRRTERLLDRYRLLFEFTRDLILLVRPDGSITDANQAATHVYGYDRETLLTMNVADLRHPATLDSVPEQLAAAAATGIRFETMHRRRDGSTFPVEVSSRGADLGGERVLLSIIRDMTERRSADEELRRRETLLNIITDNADSALLMTDAAGRLTFVNPAFTRLTGYTPEEAIGRSAHEIVHYKYPDGRPFPIEECPLDRAYRATRQAIRLQEDVFVRKDGTFFPVVVSVAPLEDCGKVVGCVAEFRDVTAAKGSEAALVRNEQVSRFLADAGAALAGITDRDSTLGKVAALAVPRFADWCAIDMFENGAFRRAAVVHSDPDKIHLAHEYHRRFPPNPAVPRGLWNILRSGASELVHDITDEMIEAVENAEQKALLQQLGFRSYIGVPLKVRDEIIGVMTFVAAESGRRFDERDVALAEDLAQRTAVAVENVRLYDELRDADRRKNEFLAMLGHELRNPLAPIRSGLDLLRIEGAPHDLVDLMSDQLEHLVRLVDDLLDVSRILRGRVELKRRPVDLVAVVRRSCDVARPLFEAQTQELTVSLPSEPIQLEADAVRLTQVFSNLLNNASKYTEAGGRIAIEVERKHGEAVVCVRDSGMGIDRHLLPHVFGLFTQSTRTIDRSQGGLGLGLTIVRNLVEMHGGTVFADSEGEGRGSQFTVRLPLNAIATRSVEVRSESPVAIGRKVLVVDDNIPAAKLLVQLVLKLGPHEVVTAHDGEGAMTAAEAYSPDLILLDIGLPRMDGYEVARRLRADLRFRDVLIVALTGYGSDEDRRRAAEAGFDEHITKPPSIETLQRVLSHPKLRTQ